MKTAPSQYVGRFAPSPTGSLHFGSLVAALGSYLCAKSHQGKWLVRIEDIDPPREIAGATSAILRTLEMHGLHWDDEVIMQSERTTLYHHALTQLTGRGLIYACDCTRAKLRELGGIYTGFCRERQLKDDNTALRIRNTHHHAQFQDGLMGSLQNEYKSPEDFIIKRKDGFFAYHLAMVVDDWEQGITEVVRGVDLIQPTFNQLSLHQALGHSAPTHVHLPVAVNEKGQKLSKQNRAPVLDDRHASSNLIHALYFLEQQPPAELSGESTETILQWATQHWCLKAVPPVEKKSALC